jgi:hypothetical protein
MVAGKAEEIARDLAPDAWQRLSAGEGTKGARLHDWAYCELADLGADEYDETSLGFGPAVSSSAAISATVISPSSRHGAQRGLALRRSFPSKAIAGRLRIALKQPRTNSDSTTTRPDHGMAGIAMSRSSCSPSL